MILMEHGTNKNILEEMNSVILGKLETIEMINKIKKRYSEIGYKYNNGLIKSGVMLFNNNEKTTHFFKDWWDEINNYSHRDQLSANYVLWKHKNIKYELNDLLNNKFFKQTKRISKRLKF